MTRHPLPVLRSGMRAIITWQGCTFFAPLLEVALVLSGGSQRADAEEQRKAIGQLPALSSWKD